MPKPASSRKPSPKKARTPSEEEEERFPNLAAERRWDREQHVKRAVAGGLSRAQAEKHADDEVGDDEE